MTDNSNPVLSPREVWAQFGNALELDPNEDEILYRTFDGIETTFGLSLTGLVSIVSVENGVVLEKLDHVGYAKEVIVDPEGGVFLVCELDNGRPRLLIVDSKPDSQYALSGPLAKSDIDELRPNL